jgi:hypothetical protein
MEKQLDDISVQCDKNDRLVGEKEELLKVIGFWRGEPQRAGRKTFRRRSSRKW